MELKKVATQGAPNAIGPYSQAMVVGDFVFCSGQVAMAPGGTDWVGGTVAEQTRLVLANLKAVLEEAGSSLDHVAKTTVYLTDMDHFPELNDVYAEVFGDSRPARATVAVRGLPKGALVEIDAVAAIARK